MKKDLTKVQNEIILKNFYESSKKNEVSWNQNVDWFKKF